MTEVNRIKQDSILKEFWRNNQRFADLFNTALFRGETVLLPETLQEADTDTSSMLRFNGHAETIQRVFDVVKKTSQGVDYVIWGLENQSNIHYAMPLRQMLGDALSYLKEYQEIAAENKKNGKFASSSEFLSNLQRTDRLHPVISLCVYYGESAWDGPTCLTDMLLIPERVKPLVGDYRLHLLQLRESDELHFQNSDVQTVFEVTRSIYRRDYGQIEKFYKERDLSAEIGVVIGSITDSQKIIEHALKAEQEGRRMNMCTALKELEEKCYTEGRQEGKQEGLQEGEIKGTIKMCRKFGLGPDAAAENIRKEFSMTEEKASAYVEKYW